MLYPFASLLSVLLTYLFTVALATSPTPGANPPQKKLMTQEEWMQQQMEEHRRDMEQLFGSMFNDDDPFESINKMRERFEQAFGQGDNLDSLGGPKLKLGLTEAWITSREDDNFEIYELDAKKVDKEKLEIKIQDGMISIKAQSKVDARPKSTFQTISQMQQSFSLPRGVKDSDVKITEQDDRIIIKVPKYPGVADNAKKAPSIPKKDKQSTRPPPQEDRIPVPPPTDKQFEL